MNDKIANSTRLRLAIQKSGRLADKSIQLLAKAGIEFDLHKDRLLYFCSDFPIDLMLVRDDDIPSYVADGICDMGIVGENVLYEKLKGRKQPEVSAAVKKLLPLHFGFCRLSLAVDADFSYENIKSFSGKTIATSYPNCLQEHLREAQVNCRIVELGGSVEIAPALKIADAICDLVSSGATLRSNGLREVATIFESQAILAQTGRTLENEKLELIERLLQRIQGVLSAGRSKYIMMNAPRAVLPEILKLLPGMEEPSVIPLGVDNKNVAVHAVAAEDVFWDTIEKLKKLGANSILVLPIEKLVR